MARRALKSINWSSIGERINAEERPVFLAFKAKSDQYFKRAQELPEAAPKIDWAFYKKNISTPGLVDKFQKEYEAAAIPYPEDKYTSTITEQEKQKEQEIKQFVVQVDEEIKNTEKQLQKIRNMIPYGQMTMEDFLEAHPNIVFDQVNHPSIWPHDPDMQPDGTDRPI